MSERDLNVLEEKIFTVQVQSNPPEQYSLSEILAHLVANSEPIEFLGLAPYQAHAWHAFLCQLAALALIRHELPTHQLATQPLSKFAPTEPAKWRELLLELTQRQVEPWCLWVKDLGTPAFMQPPVPEGSLSEWKQIDSPAEIDVLVAAKNHDLKRKLIQNSRPEHWTFALISVQTMAGYDGQKNYGIVRMNGGYGNRPCFTVAANERWNVRFVRDVKILLAERQKLIDEFGFKPNGKALLWVLPWDGKTTLQISELDPFFIEICRRIRLDRDSSGRLSARFKGSDKRRIEAEKLRGNLGDIWTPINRKEASALTVRDLSYRRLSDVLFSQDYALPPSALPNPNDGESPVLMAEIMARDQGKTVGFFHRNILVPPKAKRILSTPTEKERLAKRSKDYVESVDRVAKEVLKPALLVLLQGDPAIINKQDPRAEPFLEQLDQRVDQIFFHKLFDSIDQNDLEARAAWLGCVVEIAKDIFSQALQSVPIPSARYYRAVTAAERIFYGSIKNRFPDLKTNSALTEREKVDEPRSN